jgi:hypothetical protein
VLVLSGWPISRPDLSLNDDHEELG